MKRKVWYTLFLLAFALNINAQNDSIVRITKYNSLESQNGVLIKLVDKKINGIEYHTNGWMLKCKVRTVIKEGGNSYFLIIESPEAKIEYSDLIELNTAFDRLFKEVDSDCALKPDYLENRFTTMDGFRIGYFVEKGKAHWFINNHFNSRMGFLEIKKPYEFAKGLRDAQNEIEMMMKNK